MGIEDAETMDDKHVPMPLDSLAKGVDKLVGILVVNVVDGSVFAAWLSPSLKTRPIVEYAVGIRAAYHSAAASAMGSGRPMLTIETTDYTTVLVGIRTFVIGTIFNADCPLGVARISAKRIAKVISPELPFAAVVESPDEDQAEPQSGDDLQRHTLLSPQMSPSPTAPRSPPAPPAPDSDREVETQHFGRGQNTEADFPLSDTGVADAGIRAKELLTYIEKRAPEPHIVKLRVALRSGLSLVALDHPETLGPDALILIETAVEDILGVDRSEWEDET